MSEAAGADPLLRRACHYTFRGSMISKVEPWPRPGLEAVMVPPCSSTSCFTRQGRFQGHTSVFEVAADLRKHVEDGAEFGRIEAEAGVRDANDHALAALGNSGFDTAAGRRVFGGIVQKIGDALGDAHLIGDKREGGFKPDKMQIVPLASMLIATLRPPQSAPCASRKAREPARSCPR